MNYFISEEGEERPRLGIAFVVLVITLALAMSHYLAFTFGGAMTMSAIKKEVETKAETPRLGFSCKEALRICRENWKKG